VLQFISSLYFNTEISENRLLQHLHSMQWMFCWLFWKTDTVFPYYCSSFVTELSWSYYRFENEYYNFTKRKL